MSDTIQFTTKGFLGGPKTLTLDGEKAVYTGKECFRGNIHDEIKINEVRYFDVLGKKVRFGYKEQIFMKGLKKEEIETIRKHLENHGAKLGADAEWYSKGLDFCCCTHEQLAVVDDGVMFRSKKGRNNESTFVEWNKINVSIFPGRFCGRFVTLLGELDIVTTKKFPAALVNKIKEGIKTRGINVSGGNVYRPPIWKCTEHFKSCLILTDKGVVAKLSKKAVSASELPSNSKKGAGTTIFIPYKNITKIGNAKGLKGYFRIEGSITDLRTQEPAKITIVMMKPYCWCSVKGEIKGKMH